MPMVAIWIIFFVSLYGKKIQHGASYEEGAIVKANPVKHIDLIPYRMVSSLKSGGTFRETGLRILTCNDFMTDSLALSNFIN